jgi:hypothetical protein
MSALRVNSGTRPLHRRPFQATERQSKRRFVLPFIDQALIIEISRAVLALDQAAAFAKEDLILCQRDFFRRDPVTGTARTAIALMILGHGKSYRSKKPGKIKLGHWAFQKAI